MSFTYSLFIAGQEQPEHLPNEVAYRMAGLLGCPHHVAHRALVKVNPEVWFNAWGDALLSYEGGRARISRNSVYSLG
jgi:hypothetical protein